MSEILYKLNLELFIIFNQVLGMFRGNFRCYLMYIFVFLFLRCCGSCGRVLEDYFFAEEPSFVKNAAGQVMEA